MDLKDKKYIIGIDLGTTNSAVSYVDLENFEEKKENGKQKKEFIRVFNIPQLTGPGEFSSLPVLPSFLYIPGEYDISDQALKHPWKKQRDIFTGAFARDHGSKIPARLVSSAKSWLCHQGADRQAKILPWGSEKIEKVSPVTATAEYLSHIRKAWNHSVKDEDLFFENQLIIITVPASFDETARELTLNAAKEAGLGSDITLLEEPLAAFYSWLVVHEHDWQNYVKPDDLIFVCDVGGGTTDFTLITLKKSEGTPRFERLAVGDHLILGGDNIDLAIAHHIESKFKNKRNLSPDKWKTLCHKCRQAKEKILENEEASVRITLRGEGKSLIAGTLAAELEKSELEKILCEKFFPNVDLDNNSMQKTGKTMADIGLPYEREPAITKHIALFLAKHRKDVTTALGKEPLPDFILFNGGSLKPNFLQTGIQTTITKWFKSKDRKPPKILENPDHDLSVALGAAYYGLVKQGTGVKVGSGSPRSYYLGISSRKNENYYKENKAVCIVERGLDEGSAINFPDMEFEVLANQPVSFDIFSSSFRSGDKTGSIITIDDSLTPMAPVHTIIRFGKKGEKKSIPVGIELEYTEMGTLAMWCCSFATNHRWKLQFQLRDDNYSDVARISDTDVFDDAVINDVRNLMDRAFSPDSDSFFLSGLVKRIEHRIERKKKKWPLSLLRTMADKLLDIPDVRKISPEHEARWLNITGFCMRPGFGDAFDEERMRKIWKIYLSGLNFPKAKQNASEWWIFSRRIAAGLKAGQQRQFFQDITPMILSKGNSPRKITPRETTEIWMAAANMERLLVKDKITLGRTLQSILNSGEKNLNQYCWALSRIGAREMLYGSVDRVISSREVSIWIKKLIKKNFRGNNAINAVAAALSGMARKTGDRTRDIDQKTRDTLVAWLKSVSADEEYIKMIQKKIVIKSKEEQTLFGESLPRGIVLKTHE